MITKINTLGVNYVAISEIQLYEYRVPPSFSFGYIEPNTDGTVSSSTTFIENAIEHGQLHTIEGGFIKIVFSKKEEMLEIRIEDNGIGRKQSEKSKKSKDHKSMALNITRQRIDNLNNKYKSSGFMIIEDYDKTLETGTKVLISLPYQVDAQTKKTM